MSERFTQDYNKASKLLESFSSFIEKVVYFSNNPDQNRQKLWDFKKDIVFNITSRATLEETYSDLLKDKVITTRSEAQTSSLSTQDASPKSAKAVNTKDPGKQFEKNDSLKSQTARGDRQNHLEEAETSPLMSNRGPNSKGGGSNQSITKLETSDEFLVQIKAVIHIDCDKIMSLIPSYSSMRSFNQAQESVFYAMCFGFFERYIQNKISQPRLSLIQFLRSKLKNIDSDIETLSSYLDKQLAPLLKTFSADDMKEDEVMQKFYENLNSNTSLYNSCILIFRRILLKILENKGLDAIYRKNTFRWMNDFSNSEQAFYEGIAELLDSNIKVFVLNFSKMVEKTFGAISGPQLPSFLDTKPSKRELTLFLDKSSNYTYILYHSKEIQHNERPSTNSSSKRNKQRSLSPIIGHDPKFSDFMNIQPSSVRNEDRKSFIPYPENQENKEANILDVQAVTTRTKKSATISGTNPFTPTSLYSRPLETGNLHQKRKSDLGPGEKEKEEGIVKTEIVGLNKARSTSPLLLEKDRGSDIGKIMLPEKESKEADSSKKATDYMNFKDTASLVDKIMDEINQKVKTGKFEKEQFLPSQDTVVKETKIKSDKPDHDTTDRKGDKTKIDLPKIDDNFTKFKSEKLLSDLSPISPITFKNFDLNLAKPIVTKFVLILVIKCLGFTKSFKS